MSQIVERMVRAAKLDANLYEEVEAEPEAMAQAVAIVVLSSIAAGIGSIAHFGIKGIILGTISALLGWFIWAFVVYIVGTKIMPEPQTSSSHGELLRTIGFSSAPGVIRILGIIPPFYGMIFFVANLWMLAAMVVAVRQALDYKGIGRAIGVCLISWILMMIITLLLGAALGS